MLQPLPYLHGQGFSRYAAALTKVDSVMLKPDFSRRSTEPEWMDDKGVTLETLDECLSQLEIINVCTLAYRPILLWLSRVLSSFKPDRPVTIFDIGCGGGDMLRKIDNWAKKKNIAVDLIGIDINPLAKIVAQKRTPKTSSIRYETADINNLNADRRADFIISSLFTHHLDDSELLRFIGRMNAHAEQGWLSNDLHRHPIAYYGIKYILASTPFTNPIVRNDAAVSVARAFTKDEWRHFLKEAGIPVERTSIEWFFPFRFGVACRKA
jgi:SAM-dependent methyltransferase